MQFIRNNNTFTLTSISSNGACYIDCLDFPIYFKGGKTYVLTSNFTTNNSDAYIRLFKALDNGATKTFLQSEESITSDKIVKTFNPIEDIVVYPSFYVARSTDGKLGGITTYTNFQVEEGSSATSYEPFKQHTLSSNRVIGYEENCYNVFGGGAKHTNTGIYSMLADVEGLSIAYVVGGSSHFTFWDKDDVFISGKHHLDTSLSSYDKNGFIQVPSNAKYMRFASGNETTSNT